MDDDERSVNPMSVMADEPVAVRPCSIADALEILGERWSLLAIRELGYGVHRFSKIVGFTGAPRDILADRLRKLEAAGIVERQQYSEHPPRFEYHLTEAGEELLPVMLALRQWGDRWASREPALTIRHSCGHTLETVTACQHCGQAVDVADMTPARVDGAAANGSAAQGPEEPMRL